MVLGCSREVHHGLRCNNDSVASLYFLISRRERRDIVMNTYKVDIFKISLGLSVISSLIILSFRDYFLYVPFQGGFNLFSFLGFTALIGWICLVLLPPVFFLDTKSWNSTKYIGFFVAVTLFTVSTLGVKIYSLATLGTIFADYLVLYPALFFIEWMLPIFYIFVALSRNKSSRQNERSPKNRLPEEVSAAQS